MEDMNSPLEWQALVLFPGGPENEEVSMYPPILYPGLEKNQREFLKNPVLPEVSCTLVRSSVYLKLIFSDPTPHPLWAGESERSGPRETCTGENLGFNESDLWIHESCDGLREALLLN